MGSSADPLPYGMVSVEAMFCLFFNAAVVVPGQSCDFLVQESGLHHTFPAAPRDHFMADLHLWLHITSRRPPVHLSGHLTYLYAILWPRVQLELFCLLCHSHT
ncbi:hypothetical protein NPIL_164091 [Nephila pilipes]|uniref:Uncharacterized protein n=1 Tax=Nephila pilipes TaxID=299642 RepID=A0A8X6TQ59_NEPPI|nr:hypothetical protein NPIL_164091 [Nephila pilipes]